MEFLSFTPLTVSQQRYLTATYTVLAGGCFTTYLGYKFSDAISSGSAVLPAIGSIGLIMYLYGSSGGKLASLKDLQHGTGLKRLLAFLGLTALTGISLAPLMDFATIINPAIVSTALIAATSTFIAFSLAAMFNRNRKYLALGGVIGSAFSYLTLIRLANFYFRSPFTREFLMWGGLAIHCLYLLYNTQAVIADFDRGRHDIVGHALVFYMDAVQVFIRLINILLENERRKNKSKRN